MQVQSLDGEDVLKEGIATHSSILAWRIPWTEEPGGLQSIGFQRVRHDWSDLACTEWDRPQNTRYFSTYSLFFQIPVQHACFSHLYLSVSTILLGFPGGSVVKNLPAKQDMWVQSLGQKDPLEKENGNPLQYSCLRNAMDRGAWRTTVHGVANELDTTEWLINNRVLCCVLSHSVVSDSLRPGWLTVHQASLSMEFFRQECWNKFPFPNPGDLPHPGIEPTSLASPVLARGLLTTVPAGKPQLSCYLLFKLIEGWTGIRKHKSLYLTLGKSICLFLSSVNTMPWTRLN